MVEYRLCWSASSNATFRGETDWEEWQDDGEPEDVLSEREIRDAPYNVCPGLEMVLEAAGFDWWVETRVAEGADV